MITEKIDYHPFHPEHSFVLTDSNHNHLDHCSLCNQTHFSTLIYQCEEYPNCNFKICRECITVVPNIDYPGHDHKLCFMRKVDEDVACDADDGYCKRGILCDELERTAYSLIFRCVPCKFNIVHLICGPLPRTIKYENHIHPLLLTQSVVVEEDNSGAEYYCDICEEKRDERIRVYYCETCKYVAHIHCLILEITSLLNGKVEDRDKLPNNIGNSVAENDMKGNKKTLKDIIESLNEEDKERFEEHFVWQKVFDSTYGDIHGSTTSTISEKYFFPRSKFDFEKLIHKFDKYCNFRRLNLEPSDLEVKVITVKHYMVAWYLEKDLLNLLEHHGDHLIDDASSTKLSLEMKSLAFHFLCKVIYDMDRTRKKDITEAHIRDWYGYLNFVRHMGFRIMFVYEQLENVKHVFIFRIQPSRLEHDIPNKLLRKKSRLQQQIQKVQADIKECKEYSITSILQNLRLTNKFYRDDEASEK